MRELSTNVIQTNAENKNWIVEAKKAQKQQQQQHHEWWVQHVQRTSD